MMDDVVWYVGYGSNLDPSRFAVYLTGGRALEARRTARGARDRAPARSVRPVHLAARLGFAGRSRTWGGGGIAYLDRRSSATTSIRATGYLVTREQFEDVAAQESGRAETILDWDELFEGGVSVVGDRPYDRLVLLGHHEGVPEVTFTHPDPPTATATPVAAYLRRLAAGLRQVHELDDSAIADYLLSADGVAPKWTRDDLLGAIQPNSWSH